jgi:hypothetical protein
MYCLWKSQGVTVHPWRKDIVMGAVIEDQHLYISLQSEEEWEGRLVFDTPRSAHYLNMPLDWPRINQFPEWYTVSPAGKYEFSSGNSRETRVFTGKELAEGLPFRMAPGELYRFRVSDF